MKSKVFSAMLAVSIIVHTEVVGFAAENTTISDVIPMSMAVLTTDDGVQHIVEGEPVLTQYATGDSGAISTTFKYNISERDFISGPMFDTAQGHDGAYASTVYLTITYFEQNNPNEYLLTGVSGHWVVGDSRVVVTSASLNYGCSEVYPDPTTQSKINVSVRNNFSISTGFTDYVSESPGSVVGANLTLDYLMGSSRTWSFTLYNQLL